MAVQVARATAHEFHEAWAIVNEYYEAVGVVVREDIDAFNSYYFGDGAGLWLARIDGCVVGCIALRPLTSRERAAEVKRLYVQPASRGAKVAAKLLAQLESYARGAGYEWLYLDSKDDLEAAIAFYRKHGYVDCGRYNENPQATVFMRKRI